MSKSNNRKLYDVCVKLGTYKDGEGNTKGRYLNCGAILQNENGPYLVLNALPIGDFNGILSLFKPQESKPTRNVKRSDDDELPF